MAKSVTIKRIGPKDFTKEKYAEKKIAAMIITTSSGDSYDQLYQKFPQTPPDPDQFVSVYSFPFSKLDALFNALKPVTFQGEDNNHNIQEKIDLGDFNVSNNNNNNSPSNEVNIENERTLNDLIEEMKQLSGENIVLNFECCGGCSEKGFAGVDETVLNITKLAIDKKFIIMFSDFSLKSLIRRWDSSKLGPKPFKIVDSFSTQFTLEFDPKTLIDCPFAQLQNVGELCEKGIAFCDAMPGTILYSVKGDYLAENPPYKLTCLTIVTKADGAEQESSPDAIVVGEKKGLAGHVMLEYENGGKILTSCGHWVELVKLDVTYEKVFKLVQKQYGDCCAIDWSNELSNLSPEEQNQKLQFDSFTFVQSAAPCQYSKK